MSLQTILDKVDAKRLIRDTLELVNIESITGNSKDVADRYVQMLEEVGCSVERYEYYPNNPTLVAVYGEKNAGKTIIFNGHMDVIPLAHEDAAVKEGRIYGRGTCDMKGSLACMVEVLRCLQETNTKLPGNIVVIANSLHESPGGRGEDLTALVERVPLTADAVIVMEGATTDCTVAQLGSATFEIAIERAGETCHQLKAPVGTPHPITIAAEVVQLFEEWNRELEKTEIEDIGYASYFIGAIESGKFYNQFPATASITGVRRYAPSEKFEDVVQATREGLDRIAAKHGVEIKLDMKKVRDGYRIDKNSEALHALSRAVVAERNIEYPLVGKKIVTDAGIFGQAFGVPVLCHGPDALTAHGDVEYVEIRELETITRSYLRFIDDFLAVKA
ncbi:M20 family metallopeptidase [Paenibacillus spongiae]|uniref:M20 family metallopeptidase n=1 Tax=Paenibacillus spongiae TaxID=2909671 RepID=A0ABY5S1M2_9BACL|nr:M20 family metallopeptidase [Paenibacillus spongiae]UVI27776.1 M20 family metallopeptidase [Paenibacillus spongiae]